MKLADPNQREYFFLQLLLHKMRCPTLFQDLRTVNEQVCTPTERQFKIEWFENEGQSNAIL